MPRSSKWHIGHAIVSRQIRASQGNGTIDKAQFSTRARPRRQRTGRRLSAILRQTAADKSRDRIAISDIFEAVGDRAIGAMMLIFAMPNLVPTPPGTSAVLGAPLVVLAAQLMTGLPPWLPAFIAKRSLERTSFEAIVTRINPWLMRAERMLKPRLGLLVYPPAEYLAGFICFLLAIVLTLPVPLGNLLPAFAICLFSFGILGRDGLFILFGLLASAVSAAVAGGVIYGLVKGVFFFVARMF